MSNKNTTLLAFALIAISVLAGLVLYARLPDPMPSHWNEIGRASCRERVYVLV